LSFIGYGCLFFDTEEEHTVVPANSADIGGRATPQGLPGSPPMDIGKGTGARLDHRGQAGSDPVTFFGEKKNLHILGNTLLMELHT